MLLENDTMNYSPNGKNLSMTYRTLTYQLPQATLSLEQEICLTYMKNPLQQNPTYTITFNGLNIKA